MAVQNYLTLSHLRKVVASITQKINNLKPDWNAKAGEEGYIVNKTHWKEIKTITLASEQTLDVEFMQTDYFYYANGEATSELSENLANIQEGDKIFVRYQGTDYVCEVEYNNEYGQVGCSNIECTDYQFGISFDSNGSLYIDFYYLNGRYENIPETITISVTMTINIYHQLDNKYINGKFVQSGTGNNSEIFNDYENNVASGDYSHSEGGGTQARSTYSHTEGYHTFADGEYSHSEGYNNETGGTGSHAEGYSTYSYGIASHSEGRSTNARGDYSYAGGYNTTAQRRSQHVFGEYNVLDTGGSSESSKGTYIEIVGNGTGTSASKRSNARTLDWNGNEILKGKLTVGTAPTNNMDVATKQYVDNATSGITTNLNGLTDTTITSPSDGQILRYDNSSSKWINSNETTYTFDGTYNASTNKAATVSTVTDAIGALTIPTKTSDLTNDSGFMTGMTILSYGSSSWADFIDAYTNKRVVYCRASSNSNPASGSQTRLAFMAYVNNADNPTNVEFQYYRSVSSHSNTQQGDQVYVYKLDKSSGWSVTVRESYTKVVAGTGLTGNWASGAITLSLNSNTVATTSANGLMSSTDKSRLDTLYADYSSALTALGVN